MNNQLATIFKSYGIISPECSLCTNDTRVHSIRYIGITKSQDNSLQEGIILLRPGYARDFGITSVLQHFWQEIEKACSQVDRLAFMFDMEKMSYSYHNARIAIAMHTIINTFKRNDLGRIIVINPSKYLALFLKVIPLLNMSDLTIIKLEQLPSLLTHEQLKYLLSQ